MKLTAILLFIASVALGQSDTIKYWSDLKTPLYHSGDLIPASAQGQLVTVELPANQPFKVVPAVITWSLIQTHESTSASWTYSGFTVVPSVSGQDKFSARDFAWVTGTLGAGSNGAALIVTVPANSRIGFWSERSSGHNPYTFKISQSNAVKMQGTIDPRQGTANSDYVRNAPSWYSGTLEAGSYKIDLTPSGQMVIDKVTIETMSY